MTRCQQTTGKLHLVINDQGELLACCLTPANVDDRRPVPQLAQRLFGKLIGDKGYLSKDLVAWLLERGVELLTPLKRPMSRAWSGSTINCSCASGCSLRPSTTN